LSQTEGKFPKGFGEQKISSLVNPLTKLKKPDDNYCKFSNKLNDFYGTLFCLCECIYKCLCLYKCFVFGALVYCTSCCASFHKI